MKAKEGRGERHNHDRLRRSLTCRRRSCDTNVTPAFGGVSRLALTWEGAGRSRNEAAWAREGGRCGPGPERDLSTCGPQE